MRLMDHFFEGGEHSLLNNLDSVREESWHSLPQGAKRSIREIAKHVGLFKYMYANHAFRGATLDYSDAPR